MMETLWVLIIEELKELLRDKSQPADVRQYFTGILESNNTGSGDWINVQIDNGLESYYLELCNGTLDG